MRFVVFDDETMEAITVVSLPGIGERDIWDRMQGRLRLPVPPSSIVLPLDVQPTHPQRFADVELWFERFLRNGRMTTMCFTKASELALLLEPDFLPGQRPRLQELENRNRTLSDLILEALSR